MQKAILGKKIGMTQIFTEDGLVIPVTVIEAGPVSVVQKKTVENDGYNAIQVGYVDAKEKVMNKPQKGHLAKAGVSAKRVLKEFRLADTSSLNVGDIVKADIFAAGEFVDVVGTSKGKGTAGVIKRWNFGRLRETHGTGPVARHGGSLGVIDPARIFKGKKMAGHLGTERVTVQNLSVVKVDSENNLIAIKGSVPGPKGGIVVIADSVKKA